MQQYIELTVDCYNSRENSSTICCWLWGNTNDDRPNKWIINSVYDEVHCAMNSIPCEQWEVRGQNRSKSSFRRSRAIIFGKRRHTYLVSLETLDASYVLIVEIKERLTWFSLKVSGESRFLGQIAPTKQQNVSRYTTRNINNYHN